MGCTQSARRSKAPLAPRSNNACSKLPRPETRKYLFSLSAGGGEKEYTSRDRSTSSGERRSGVCTATTALDTGRSVRHSPQTSSCSAAEASTVGSQRQCAAAAAAATTTKTAQAHAATTPRTRFGAAFSGDKVKDRNESKKPRQRQRQRQRSVLAGGKLSSFRNSKSKRSSTNTPIPAAVAAAPPDSSNNSHHHQACCISLHESGRDSCDSFSDAVNPKP